MTATPYSRALQIPFISTIGGSHSDRSVSNAWEERERRGRGGECRREAEWWSGRGWGSAWRLERELPPDKSHLLGFAINLTLQNRHVLVSCLSALISFLSHSSSGRICFFFWLCNRSWSLPLPHLHVSHLYTLPSLHLFCLRPASVMEVSRPPRAIIVISSVIWMTAIHYLS